MFNDVFLYALASVNNLTLSTSSVKKRYNIITWAATMVLPLFTERYLCRLIEKALERLAW